jgi:crotonobetainyl-CoA:carnitine CoA-transferase CaiB-like acyl-CoA transferase
MTVKPMTGVKVVEVAQFTFTPAAGAVLADWGADVIKVEHAEKGDAQRGLKLGTGGMSEASFHPLMEHPNRGKRSIGLALEIPAARQILMELVREADVFLTNFLADARRRLGLEVEDIRRVNPDVIYVRGTGHGVHGPDADKGGYDGSTFWCRTGSAWLATAPDSPRMVSMPGGAFGDSMGGMTIAGGVAAALFARERSGEPSVIDVSLMGVGAWANALAITTALVMGETLPRLPLTAPMTLPVNPLMGACRTSDDRWIQLMMLQPSRYFEDACRHLGIESLLDDERFSTPQGIFDNAVEIGEQVAEAIRKQPYAYWVERLQTMEGPWSPVQDPLEVAEDPQMEANGYLIDVVDADGRPRRLIANPVQFDETPMTTTRGPQFAEHTDDILRELGHDEEEIIRLKLEGACT